MDTGLNILPALAGYAEANTRMIAALARQNERIAQEMFTQIERGFSSGNIGYDAAVAIEKTVDVCIVAAFGEIAQAVAQTQRQMILVVRTRVEYSEDPEYGDQVQKNIECVCIGKLTGATLRIRQREWLPVAPDIVCADIFDKHDPHVTTAGILGSADDYKKLPPKWMASWQNILYIGNDAVAATLEKRGASELFDEAARMLGIPIP